VSGGIDVEPVRREPLHTERRPGSRCHGPAVAPHTGDHVPPSRVLVAEEHLRGRLFDAAAPAHAFGAVPDAVAIAPNPAPRLDRSVVTAQPLETIGEHEEVD